ncbi:MAG TPA: hypothetical protein VJB02_05910, partial [Coxiellaceae bacterium]|nr:hypothetical protein [Coxiellaceae bacterium]
MPILTRPAAQSAFGQFRTLLGAPPEGETPAEIRENYRIKWAGFQLRHRNRLEAELARHGVALSEKGYGQVSFPSAPAMGEGGGRTTAREEAAAAPPERIAAVESKEDVGTQVRSSDDHYVSVMMLATLHIQLYFSQELDKKPLYFTRCIKPLLLLLGPDFEFYTLKISREGEGQVWQLPPTFRCFPPSIESHDRSLFLEMLALECPQLLVPTDGSVSFWGRAVIQHVESVSPSIPLGVFWGRVLTSFSPSVLPIIFDTPAFGDRLRAELTRLNGKPFAQYTFVQQFLEQEFPALSGRTDHRGMREWKSNVFEALQAMGFCTAPPEV